jgi:2-polyprenyl-6-methoxyphenol hydroxylase-like FAD-dependent oxidoreductase
VTDIESGPRTLVRLEDGRTIDARLVIMATGLNTKLGKRLGVDYETISAKHSTTVGFDIRSPKCTPAETSVLVYYGNDLQDGVDYLTVFPCKDVLRGNLFLYRDPLDPWVRQLRQTPRETLLEVLPALADELGDFTIEHLQCRVSDVAVARRHQRDGLVLIGDAYQTPCPAAGTGITRLLVDVERLTVHATRWFAANDTSAEALRSYYNDAVKRRSDRAAIRVARFRRAISTNTSPLWALQRQIVRARRFVKYVLHSTRDLMVRSGQVVLSRVAKEHEAPRKSWLLSSQDAAATGMAQTPVAPDIASGVG